MIVSWNWLTDYLRLDLSVEALTERLTLSGLNLEDFSDVGGDIAIDLEVTSNRADCLGHIGIAREVSVLFEKKLGVPVPQPPTAGAPVESMTGVTVEEPTLCSRFTARVVSGVKVGPSPWWMRKRLETIGVRPISNIVDVTNYVMFECGQPLHAYDLDRLKEHRLVVRRARPGERLTAINNKVYDLTPQMLAIADADRPVGLAGVMGGLDTEISPETSNVLIESARFDPISVRRTSRALALFSPSSFRFERPIDPEATEWASRRCAELILQVAGGTLHPGLIDVGGHRPDRPAITLRLGQIARILGIEIDRATVARILSALGLEPAGEEASSLTFRPPSWRSDLEREIDLIEEVARIHGYDHIPEDRAVPLSSTSKGHRERVEDVIRQTMIGAGLDEAATFSLVEERLASAIGPGPSIPPLRVEHSSRRRESALRQSLVPSLLAARQHNEAHGQFDADLFEIANTYAPSPEGVLPDERTRLALVASRDFRGLKGIVETLLDRLHIEQPLTALPVEVPMLAPGRAAELRLGDALLGYIGELDPARLESLELRESCAATELELDVLLKEAVLVAQNRPMPPFPGVVRDLSLVVARDLPWGKLEDVVRAAAGPKLEAVHYLDTFEGGNLPEGTQSLHFGMTFRHPERTLTGEEVEAAVKAVVAASELQLGARLRG